LDYYTYIYIYIYIYGNVNETLCIAILNKQKYLFSKMENRKVKQVLSDGLVPVGGGGYKERVWGG
jgi:hypothetical protein